ncbi:MAG: 50S ribosomal protein L5 [Candidatus Eisenbacteria bacterium]
MAKAPAKAPANAAQGRQQGGKKGGSEKGSGPKTATGPIDPPPPSRLKEFYHKEVIPALTQRFGYTSAMQVPALKKIVVNMGVGDALQNVKLLDGAAEELGQITGQRPSIRRAKKSIANFKLREGLPIGCMVTLRGPRMWEFLDRLTSIALPRVRDFRGLPTRSFDGRGNYTFGLKEQVVFPEIQYDKVEKIRGMDITLVTSAQTDEEGLELLKAMKWPFRQR